MRKPKLYCVLIGNCVVCRTSYDCGLADRPPTVKVLRECPRCGERLKLVKNMRKAVS